MSKNRIGMTKELFGLLKEVSEASEKTNKHALRAVNPNPPTPGFTWAHPTNESLTCKVKINVVINDTDFSFKAEDVEAHEWLRVLFGKRGFDMIWKAGTTFACTETSSGVTHLKEEIENIRNSG